MDRIMKAVAYEAVYNQIVANLQKGVVPWKQSWKSNLPKNGKTGRAYRGINVIILGMAGYADSRWLTFNQAKSLGGSVAKGQKAHQVVFWKIFEKEDKTTVPMLRYYNVWNAEQTEGCKLDKMVEIPKPLEAESVVAGYIRPPQVQVGASYACYQKATDVVKVPAINQFEQVDEYYATLFHELVHSTGHEKRLNRASLVKSTGFGTELYSEEELVAEFGASFLCNHAGLENALENSASYIQGWLKYLKDNPKMLVHCASKAQTAVDYILNTKDSEEPDEE